MNKKIEEINDACQDGLVDIVSGPLSVEELNHEIFSLLKIKDPEAAIVIIKREEGVYGRYHASVYLSKEDYFAKTVKERSSLQ